MNAILPNVTLARFSIGIFQAATLTVLYQAVERKSWLAADGLAFAPLLMVAIVIPILIISGLSNVRPRVLTVWTAVATAVCAALAYYDIARDPIVQFGTAARIFPSGALWFSLAVVLFVSHTMVIAGETDRRLIATYPTHFNVAWKHGVQFALAISFVATLWGLLFLGAELFRLIRIEFVATLIRNSTFSIPVTTLAFCCAIHITDVRANIVQGTQTLTLVLLSWLLPVMALIAAGFVIALPFTGLEPLWATRRATTILLIAAAILIVLVNTAHRDGRAQDTTTAVIRYAKPVAAVIVLPLVALAAYAVYLRIAQYGWTPSRISALACILIAAFYATGYVVAVARAGASMRLLESTNYVTALATVVLLLALRSPILDPARISVTDQVQRLLAGKVVPEKFDYSFLRYRAGRFGTSALEQLAAHTEGPQAALISDTARRVLRLGRAVGAPANLPPITADMRARNIATVQPPGATLPETFLQQDWSSFQPQNTLPRCLISDMKCEAIVTDLTGDDQPEVLLFALPLGGGTVFKFEAKQGWQLAGTLTNVYCSGVRDALRAGLFETAPAPFKELIVDGQRLYISEPCKPAIRRGVPDKTPLPPASP
jgi:hypothetical protein